MGDDTPIIFDYKSKTMGKLNIKESIEVKINASKTWEIIGPNFLNISEWGRGVIKSWENESAPKYFENSPAGGRFCEVAGFWEIRGKYHSLQ